MTEAAQDWRCSNCHEPKVVGDRQSCPICWGKGTWLGYSDAEWARNGGRKPPTTQMRCGNCRGLGHVKHYPSHVQQEAHP